MYSLAGPGFKPASWSNASRCCRATRAPQLLRWLLAIGAIFVAWRVWRGLKRVFRVAFGLGMALYWTGFWRVVFQDAVQGGRA